MRTPSTHGATRTVRALALMMVAAFIVVACGQQPGVRVAELEPEEIQGFLPAGQGAPAAADDVDDDFATADDDFDDDGFATASDDFDDEDDDFATAPGDTGGDDGGNGGEAPRQRSGDQTQQPQEGSREPQGSDRTGVTDSDITIAVHAPVTGAAPLPSRSFEQARDLYFRWVTEAKGETILGRSTVNVLFRDDKYDPSSAVQVCREMASRAFFLVGGGGTDQIQACGRFANQARVPYFSAGVTERGLQGLEWYFATSMSYKQQGPLLAQYVKKEHGNAKVAAIVTDTPNFDDAIQGWEAGVQRQGLNYHGTLRHPRGDTGWYNSFARELNQAGVDVVYMLTAPVDYIRFAQQSHQQGFKPAWVGVGVTMGLNAVLGAGCPEVDGGTFFSPFPGLDWARQNEPAFFEAAQQFGTPNDDLALALWGLGKSSHVMFNRYAEIYGNDLTREDFRAVTERQSGIRTNVYPEISYSPENHFGARTVHQVRADCSREEHVTVATHASGF